MNTERIHRTIVLAAGAPPPPADWKPVMRSCPPYEITTETGAVQDNHAEVDAWRKEREVEKRIQWPIYWAMAVLSRIEANRFTRGDS